MKQVDTKQAAAILAKQPYHRRLPIGRMMIPRGIHNTKIASLHELYWFLAPSRKSLVALRFDRLLAWTRESIGDPWLAEQVTVIMAQDIPYAQQCSRLHEVLGSRIQELENILASDKEVGHV